MAMFGSSDCTEYERGYADGYRDAAAKALRQAKVPPLPDYKPPEKGPRPTPPGEPTT